MAEHELKTWPKLFQAVKDGSKRFELRKNDRGYRVGDVLRLREYEPLRGLYSGEEISVRVTYLARGVFGLDPKWVAMSIEPVDVSSENERLRSRVAELEAACEAVGKLLEYNGCDCECECAAGEHEDDCVRCLACKVEDALGPHTWRHRDDH